MVAGVVGQRGPMQGTVGGVKTVVVTTDCSVVKVLFAIMK